MLLAVVEETASSARSRHVAEQDGGAEENWRDQAHTVGVAWCKQKVRILRYSLRRRSGKLQVKVLTRVMFLEGSLDKCG